MYNVFSSLNFCHEITPGGQIVGNTVLFNFGMITGQGEGKFWIQTY